MYKNKTTVLRVGPLEEHQESDFQLVYIERPFVRESNEMNEYCQRNQVLFVKKECEFYLPLSNDMKNKFHSIAMLLFGLMTKTSC